jgi:hypothetical protein
MFGLETILVWPCTEDAAKNKAFPKLFTSTSSIEARLLDIGAGGLRMLLKVDAEITGWFVVASTPLARAGLDRVGAKVAWTKSALERERYVGISLPFLSNEERLRLAKTINRIAVDRAKWGRK